MAGVPIAKLWDKINAACARGGADPAQIILVGVTKGRAIEEVKQAIAAGVTDIGENRVQEALAKYNVFCGACTPSGGMPHIQPAFSGIRWHMVGHLQTNKVKEAVRIFDLIHSVDSVRLAKEISIEAVALNKVQEVLLEVKTSSEEKKYGIEPGQVEIAIKEISALPNIEVKGLMTIAALGNTAEEARPYFRQLRQLLAQLNAQRLPHDQMRVLSMGMSDDFEVAIEEGATMVRIGRALFDN